jgi:lysyl-tRNA synthetase class 2
MVGEVSKVVGEDLRQADDGKARELIARRLGCELKPETRWGEAIEEAFGELVEGALIEPTHIVDFPADISLLAKPSVDDPRIAERFETFCLGMEVANAFSEMNDPVAQRAILEAQSGRRAPRARIACSMPTSSRRSNMACRRRAASASASTAW